MWYKEKFNFMRTPNNIIPIIKAVGVKSISTVRIRDISYNTITETKEHRTIDWLIDWINLNFERYKNSVYVEIEG